MGVMSFLFGSKKKEKQQEIRQEVRAPGMPISYDPELTAQLTREHKQLLLIFNQIGQAFAANNLSKTAFLLEKFRSTLVAHLLTEKVRFYIYLQHALVEDAESLDIMRGFRSEMDVIGKAVRDFLSKYKGIDKHPALAAVILP